MDPVNDCLLVSFDFTNKDIGVLLVATKKNKIQELDIINAFQGEEAYEIYKLLTTKKNSN